jgi:hypothetical protein
MGYGIIKGLSVITRGPALGHGMWVDKVFVKSVHDAINTPRTNSKGQIRYGYKSRFTHPSISGDGMGKYLGRVMNARLVDDGDRVIADLHFGQSAHKSPDGNLAEYVMGLAEEDPEAFGTSIVFDIDFEAQDRFTIQHLNHDTGEFESPDELNQHHYPHVRLLELQADDVVDEPAANPDGLFDCNPIARQADQLLSYAAGLSDQMPSTTDALGLGEIHPDRLRGFLSRFLEQHNLQITKKETGMSTTTTPEQETKETTQAESTAEETPTPEQNLEEQTESSPVAESEAGETQAGDVAESEASTGDGESVAESGAGELNKGPGQKFLDAFGAKGGVWFAEGKSFEEAQVLFNKELREENEKLQKQVEALRGNEAIDCDATDKEQAKEKGALESAFRVKEK